MQRLQVQKGAGGAAGDWGEVGGWGAGGGDCRLGPLPGGLGSGEAGAWGVEQSRESSVLRFTGSPGRGRDQAGGHCTGPGVLVDGPGWEKLPDLGLLTRRSRT